MIEYANVLLATDFSEPAAHAALHAADLVRRHEARLHVVHVVEEFSYWEGFHLEHFPSDKVYDELRQNARLAIEDLFDKDARQGLSIETHVLHGKPFVEIIRLARQVIAEVIVIGSHGQTGIAETLFGSTAEKVVRKAPCAVLVVRHAGHRFELP
ncbi:MAG: universal stress protein [Gemmatimonadota bacterium]